MRRLMPLGLQPLFRFRAQTNYETKGMRHCARLPWARTGRTASLGAAAAVEAGSAEERQDEPAPVQTVGGDWRQFQNMVWNAACAVRWNLSVGFYRTHVIQQRAH
jgi:hypothetical protein